MSAALVSTFGWTLLHSLWEGTLGVLAIAAILRVLRGASPRARYAVAVAGLLMVAVVPLRHLRGSSLAPEGMVVPVRERQAGRPLPRTDQAPPRALPNPSPAPRTRLADGLERGFPWVVGAWMLGAALSLLRLAGGWVLLQRLRWHRAELASDALQRHLLDLCRRAGLKRAVTLLTCEGLPGPSVVGVLRPAILVPAGWFLDMPPSHLEALLAHELAHVLRHDYLVNLLQSLMEVLMFYHPGVWWLSRRIRAERELAADAFAARLLGDPLPLAEALTDLERRGLPALAMPAPAAHGGSLMERIESLLIPRPRTSSAPVLGAMALVALLLTGGLSLRAQMPDPTPAVAPTIPQGLGPSHRTVLFLKVEPAQDTTGRPLPYEVSLTLKADQVPLYKAWETVANALKAGPEETVGVTFLTDKAGGEGPRINLDLDRATPAQVMAVFHRVARTHGVAPWKAPEPPLLKPFVITKTTRADGTVLLDLQAKAASRPFLDTLLAEARRLHDSHDGPRSSVVLARDADHGEGPKVDALFEGLTLPELEARLLKLKREALP